MNFIIWHIDCTQEDNKVIVLVAQYGMKSWSFIAKQLQGRLGKQCRERFCTLPLHFTPLFYAVANAIYTP